MSTLPSQLRTNFTDAEKYLWRAIRNRQLGGYKFRRQYQLPPFIVDLVCLECRLIVELDGGQHADTVTSDTDRTAYLERLGYNVLRFWNNYVLENTQAVLEEVLRALSNCPSPQPSPARGEGVSTGVDVGDTLTPAFSPEGARR